MLGYFSFRVDIEPLYDSGVTRLSLVLTSLMCSYYRWTHKHDLDIMPFS